jgi:methylisocitrate lyase
LLRQGHFTGLIGRAVARAGFDACYLSGGATANTAGYPDIGLITLTEMCRTIREVARCGLPVIADADTGYGELENTVRAAREYEAAGAAAMHLEDQVFPKRCGHLDGKQLVPPQEMIAKITAALHGRSSEDFMVIARTDARGVEGLDDAITRGCAYRDSGADMIFPEGLTSVDEFAEFAQRCPGLLLANMTEFGKTPHITVEQFSEMGYDVVIFPVSMQRLAMHAIEAGLKVLKDQGSLASMVGSMQTRSDLYDVLGYDPNEPWEFPTE